MTVLDERQVKKMCLDKIRYRSLKRAINAYNNIKTDKVVIVHRPRFYKCPLCEGFHITKQGMI